MILFKHSEDSMIGGGLMSITADLLRGHTETIILAQLMHRDRYG